MAAGLVLAILLAAAPPADQWTAAAAQLPAPAGRASVPAAQPGPPSDVYSRLFRGSPQGGAPSLPGKQAAPAPPPPAKELVVDTRPRTKIVCGTTLIIVGAEPDPAMVKPRPEGGTQYPIKRMAPPACGQKK
jgi:hypothetical protein